ncbi:hypothetical protein CGRA01v4_14787 [Colletotrichum graminicola]|nr:hypothetical protein CGRA01v4_14787 [Colletotrichum graminicola]
MASHCIAGQTAGRYVPSIPHPFLPLRAVSQSHAACLGTLAHTEYINGLALPRLHPYPYVLYRTVLHRILFSSHSLSPLPCSLSLSLSLSVSPSPLRARPPLLKRRLLPICFHRPFV